MAATTEELTRPETDADRDFLPQNWCGTCRLAREAPASSDAHHLESGWALAAARAAMREGRPDFQVPRPRRDLANPEILAAVREHRANPTKYERRLNIPAAFAQSHERGARWQQHQMCSEQWRQLQLIRERDRERRGRQREHDRAVERELQTMLPQREMVAV